MTPLQSILAAYRATSQTEREKGTYFEELIRTCQLLSQEDLSCWTHRRYVR